MTKIELQSALAEATQTDKRTAGVFLDTLSALAYKEIEKNGEFVLPGLGKLVKALIQRHNRRSRFPPKPSSNFVLPRPQRTRFWG
jgi:DNA-binding protein HU-beta